MHGAYGEDGTIQRICERHHIPFTGSNSFPSNIAFNKDNTKRALQDVNVKLPKHINVKRDENTDYTALAAAIEKEFKTEYVLKPTVGGSSHGVMMVGRDASLAAALEDMSAAYDEFMVEERIRGTEATVGLLEEYRDQAHYLMPAIEIIPPSSSDFFDSEVKYNGKTTELCPGRFSQAEKELLYEAAALVHRTLGLSQYSRSDFMIRDGEVYFLEVNTLPGLTPESLFPKAAAAIGCTFPELIDHLVRTARVRN
jgi:D-alanine-D-alanine ligase